MNINKKQINLFSSKAQKTKIIILCFVLNCLNLNIYSQDLKPSVYKINLPYNPVKELKTDLELILNDEKFKNAHTGMIVYSLDRDELLFERNSNKNFVPASLQKIITTSSALFFLGPEYEFKTSFYMTGDVLENGDLLGDLIIQGNGNPGMILNDSDPYDIFYEWIYVLDSLGIKSIQGDIIADDSWFDEVYFGEGWAWDDLKYDYGAAVNALNHNQNSFEIKLYSGKEKGSSALISIKPESSYYNVINNIVTGDFDDVNFKREEGTNIIELYGTIDKKRRSPKVLNISVDDPSRFMLFRFKEILRENNIRFRGQLYSYHRNFRDVNYDNAIHLIDYQSPPLKELIKKVNKESINLYAEILLKTIAKEKTGLGSFEKGIEQIEKLLEDIDVDKDEFELRDGSGLSRMNFISPEQIIKVFSFAKTENWYEDFKNSLAMPGKEGTMEFRLKNTIAEKKLWVKTGTMNGISNVAGIVETTDGEYLTFCIMTNNFKQPLTEIRSFHDLLIMRLAGFSRIPPLDE